MCLLTRTVYSHKNLESTHHIKDEHEHTHMNARAVELAKDKGVNVDSRARVEFSTMDRAHSARPLNLASGALAT